MILGLYMVLRPIMRCIIVWVMDSHRFESDGWSFRKFKVAGVCGNKTAEGRITDSY